MNRENLYMYIREDTVYTENVCLSIVDDYVN